jgi:acetyl-CoA C-acetyltransferase
VDKDEYPRPDTTVEKLGALRAAFQKDGTVTAGNASGINDGAAAVLVTSEQTAQKKGSSALARVLAYATVGVEPKFMGMGPVPAVTRAVERAGVPLSSIEVFELNEAFAVQSVAVVRELGIDPLKVNVHGGAIAFGHPIGASGARVLTTLLYALRRRRARLGLAALCVGGGMGVAMVVERIA